VVADVRGVEDVAVIGVPDDATGSAVVAYLRVTDLDPDRTAAVVDAVRERCATSLAGFKRPSRVEVVEELPRTLAGRVRKGALRQQERRQALGVLE
jgi:long-chain acyl-CoA synthetase